MPAASDDQSGLLDTSLTHARSWVELHTSQRQNLLNFYLVAVAFLFNAYVSALNAHHWLLAALISSVGWGTSIAFVLMDLRNRDLTRAGEAALKAIEERLAEIFQLPSMRISQSIEKPRHPLLSMGKLIRFIYSSVGIIFMATTIYAFAA